MLDYPNHRFRTRLLDLGVYISGINREVAEEASNGAADVERGAVPLIPRMRWLTSEGGMRLVALGVMG